MHRYESYKASGIPWVGEIPSHWGIKKNKFLLSERKAIVGKDAPKFKLLSLTLQGVILRDMENPKGKFPAEFDTYKQVSPDDLIFCLFDVEETPRTVGLAKHHGMITGAYTVTRCNEQVSSAFLYYYYLSLDEGKRLRSLYTGLRNVITRDTFFSLATPFPPREEQDRIVAFLDQKTAEIDAAIAKKERLIELLNEQLQTIIDKAVTAGLGGDQKLTECGLDWTPLCPSGWSIRKVSHYFRAQKGREAAKLTKEYCGKIPGPYPVYSGQTENNGVMSEISNYEFDAGESGVLFSTTVGAKAMSVMHLTGRFSLSQNCMIIKPTSKEIIARFFFYQFQRIFFYYRGLIPDHMQASFRMEDLYRYCFLLPPVTEQIEIANHLDEKSAEINRAINVTRVQIERLQELRRALIAEAVTGQINIQKVTKDG